MAEPLPFDDTPWGIEFIEGANSNPWKHQWMVHTDDGAGLTLAVFEFADHAEAFVERCGPEGSSTEWRSQVRPGVR